MHQGGMGRRAQSVGYASVTVIISAFHLRILRYSSTFFEVFWPHEPPAENQYLSFEAHPRSRRRRDLKRSVLAGLRPPSALPTASLGRFPLTNTPHKGCTHAGAGRTRRYRAPSQHRKQSVIMHGSAARQPY